MINDTEVSTLFEYGFSPENRGYTPAVLEAPNGDQNVDTLKRYAHINPRNGLGPCLEIYDVLIRKAQAMVRHVCGGSSYQLGTDSTIRVLEYKPGAESHWHTDFDLFTLSVYDSNPAQFEMDRITAGHPSLTPGFANLHVGELALELDPYGWGADRHRVTPGPELRRSIVFFAMPMSHYTLWRGGDVKQWVAERKARSRVAAGGAK